MPTRPPVFGAQQRGNSNQRGYTYRWGKARKRFLREHPLCVECAKAGKVRVATVVDHVIPHRGDMVKFWEQSNWQALCAPHHAEKTARGE